MPNYPCRATGIVFRGLRAGSWTESGSITQKAYFRRKPDPTRGSSGDPNGLSFGVELAASVDFISPHGIAKFCCENAQRLENRLDSTMVDTELSSSSHGNIKNIPYYDESASDDYLVEVKRLAVELANMSTLAADRQASIEIKRRNSN